MLFYTQVKRQLHLYICHKVFISRPPVEYGQPSNSVLLEIHLMTLVDLDGFGHISEINQGIVNYIKGSFA